MRKLLLLSVVVALHLALFAQLPCSKPVYRQFDFWIGEWEAYNPRGMRAGESKISLLLDSCTILEEWTSSTVQKGLRFAGKSFNMYNAEKKSWQQYWVDNTGVIVEYLMVISRMER